MPIYRVIFFKNSHYSESPVAWSNNWNGAKLGIETNNDMESRILWKNMDKKFFDKSIYDAV